jgi:hypothetical protein
MSLSHKISKIILYPYCFFSNSSFCHQPLVTCFLILLLLIGPRCFTQTTKEKDNDLVQFSGIVVTADSLRPVPYTHIVIKNTRWGTVADYFGYFSFVARRNDTILFTAMGFKKSYYVIPDTITRRRYSLIKALTADTTLLDETVIYPWPSKEQFREAFIKLKIPDDDLVRAQKNLELAEMRERAEFYAMDGSMNYKNYMQQQIYNRNYYIGQTQPISILDPFAWAQFFKAWKEGKFKRKKK